MFFNMRVAIFQFSFTFGMVVRTIFHTYSTVGDFSNDVHILGNCIGWCLVVVFVKGLAQNHERLRALVDLVGSIYGDTFGVTNLE